MKQPDLSQLMADAFRCLAGARYLVHAEVVMLNHVHDVVWPRAPWTLSKILHAWKSFTANEINRRLGRRGRRLWQVKSFDHLVRNDEDMARCRAYMVNNPVKAGRYARPDEGP